MIKKCWIDAGLLKKEDGSEEIEYDDLDQEVCEEENLIQELTEQCEGLILEEGQTLTSGDEANLIENEVEVIENGEELAREQESESTGTTNFKQRGIQDYFAKK